MKNKKLIGLFTAAVLILFAACMKQKPKENEMKMVMDIDYASIKNVMVVHPKVIIRLEETMKVFEDNPNITQTDIDVVTKIKSKEIHYVSGRDALKLGETKQR